MVQQSVTWSHAEKDSPHLQSYLGSTDQLTKSYTPLSCGKKPEYLKSTLTWDGHAKSRETIGYCRGKTHDLLAAKQEHYRLQVVKHVF